jgi:hypothetical protein
MGERVCPMDLESASSMGHSPRTADNRPSKVVARCDAVVKSTLWVQANRDGDAFLSGSIGCQARSRAPGSRPASRARCAHQCIQLGMTEPRKRSRTPRVEAGG